jgi:hypothetical protein
MSVIRRLLGRVEDDGGDADGRLIARLEADGVDLSRPIEVQTFIALPNERMARQVVAKLASTGGTVQLNPAVLGRQWTVRVTIPMVVTLERMHALRVELEAFAEQHAGSYQGWGTTGASG